MASKNKGNAFYGGGYRPPVKSKYNARKKEVDGITFDSVKESRRYQQLKALEKAGLISELELQKKFVLIPAIREADSVGARGGIKKGKIIEREVAYYADFYYKDKNGNTIVEDVKGCKIGGAYQIFKIKKKLMLWRYGIQVKEI